MNIKVYEPFVELCKICSSKTAVWLPLCRDGNKQFVFPVCNDCKDKITYEIIPIIIENTVGYYFFPEKENN